MIDIIKYWMVHNVTREKHYNAEPAKKHPSKKSAETEAERLAISQPGEAFVVLEAIKVCQKVDVMWGDCIEIVVPPPI